MNPQTHHLIFNPTRGCLMAVAETAHSRGKGGHSGRRWRTAIVGAGRTVRLIGRRFLDGYASDEAQYQALLGNAVTYAQAHHLRPGIALTAEQMAQLTSDIVWLVEKTLTLPPSAGSGQAGQIVKVLVPQLYVRVQDGDLSASGALIAANSINLNLTGDLTNSGTIAGRTVVALSAENVRNLGGRISGNDLGIQARTDLDNIGGKIEAMHTLTASAGRDLNLTTTTRTQTNNQGSRTHIDRIAGLYVTGSAGTLIAAAIGNSGQGGNTTIAAGNNINLGTVAEAQQHDLTWDSRNTRKENSRTDLGTTIQTQGDLRLSAGNDLNAKAANVTSEQGALLASAGGNINLTAGEAHVQRDEASYSQSRGSWGSKKEVTTRDSQTETTALASTFTGKTAILDAGNDIHIQGSQIKALNAIAILAGNDIQLTAAENTRTESHLKDEKKSSLTISGYKKQSNEVSDAQSQITHTGSSLSSETGNVVLAANLNNTQDMNKGLVLIEGSSITASSGKVDISGQHILITASEDLSSSERTRKESNSTWAFITGLPSGRQHGLDAAEQSRTLNGSTLQGAQGITLDAQGVIDITASRIKADQGDIQISGAEVSIQSGLNSSQSTAKETTKKTGVTLRDLTGTFTPGQGIGYKTALTEEKANTTLAQTSLDAKNITIQSTSGDLTLTTVDARASNTLTLDAANNLKLASLATSDTQSRDLKKKDLAWQSNKGSGAQNETTQYNRLNAGQLKLSAGNRITADMGVKDSAALLSQEPGMGWIKQIQEDPQLSSKIDWKKIEEAHQNWDYDQQGLTPAAAVVVAIVVAYFTAGAGAEAVAGMTGTTATTTATAAQVAATQYATATAMTQAAITTLASKATVSLINNGGDLNATLHELGSKENLRQLAVAIVTAGALNSLGTTITIDGKALNAIKATDGFAANVGKNLITGLARATITSAVAGTDLETSIRTEVIASILSAAGAQGANWIGDQAGQGGLFNDAGKVNEFGRAFAHAVAGCMAGAAGASAPGSNTSAGSGCGAGALGAVVGELSAGLYNSGRAEAGLLPKTDTVAFASMMGGIAAAVAGQDAQGVAIASSTGANAAENNYLTHAQEAQRDKELVACKKSLACEIGVKLDYAGTSIKQETGLIVGVFGGMGYQTYEQGAAVVEMVKNLPETLTALKAIVNDPEFRAKVGNQIADDYKQRIDMQTRAYNEGGWDGSITAGVEAGRLAVDIVSVATAAMGAGKVVATTAKAGAEVITGAVAQSAQAATQMIQNLALKGVQVGAIHGFKSADEVNGLMSAYSYAPAWKSGTQVAETTLQPGTRVQMVVDEIAYLNYLNSNKTDLRFGGWATFDNVPSQAYARNQLAITPEFKQNVGYVIEVEITKPIQAQVGVVGSQGVAGGGGNQLNFLIPPGERVNAFKVVDERKLP